MDNVINLFGNDRKKESESVKEDEGAFDFSEVMAQNKAKAEKQRQARSKDNNSVKRSYRLKPKK